MPEATARHAENPAKKSRFLSCFDSKGGIGSESHESLQGRINLNKESIPLYGEDNSEVWE